MRKILKIQKPKIFKLINSSNLLCLISKTRLLLVDKIKLEIVQTIIDSNPEEHFYSAVFYKNFVIAAGKTGVIKLIGVTNTAQIFYLKAHGGAVNEIKIFGDKLYSCSDDSTIREWCLIERKCLRIFGGVAGHGDNVLGIDVSLCGNKLVSSGTDNKVKVWSLEQKDGKEKEIENFFSKTNKTLKIKQDEQNHKIVQFPIFSNDTLHRSYIKKVKFFGELILSKSQNPTIQLFRPLFEAPIHKKSNNSDLIFIKQIIGKENCDCFVFKSFCENTENETLNKALKGKFESTKQFEVFEFENKILLADGKIIRVYDCNLNSFGDINVEVQIEDFVVDSKFVYVLGKDSLSLVRLSTNDFKVLNKD